MSKAPWVARKRWAVDLDLMDRDRLMAGLTLRELAARCRPKLDPATISLLFNDKRRSLGTLKRVAVALGYDHTRYIKGRKGPRA
jgi:transcriptional regulator with XRE-family HTH domain